MPDYQKGKIYRLYSLNDVSKVYYGSTVQPLSKRKGQHKEQYERYLKGTYHYTTSFDIIKMGNYRMELIEAYPCDTKQALEKREGDYIRNNECVNKQIPSGLVSKKEYDKKYYKDNFEKIQKYNHDKYKANVLEERKKRKQYRDENKEKIREQKKRYAEKYKEQLKTKREVKYICDCGTSLTICKKARHNRSKKHQDYLASLQ